VRIAAHFIFFVTLLGVCQGQAEDTNQEELPDNYLPFEFLQYEDRLEGGSEFLEGFTLSMNVPQELLGEGFSIETLFSLVRDQIVTGTVTYPSGRTTPIEYEIVRHREIEEIYMKSSLGYFLWEYLFIHDGKMSFAIYWWYRPPATEKDLEIIALTEKILADPNGWNRDDDRECEGNIETNQWSLFCALKYSSMEIMREYNHHGTAIQSARFVIDDLVPNHGFVHTLMDYNNESSTSHLDIMHVLDLARLRIEGELKTQQSGNEPKDE